MTYTAMSYAKGANMQLLLQRETAFRVLPGSPDAIRLSFIEFGVGRDPGKVQDPSISRSPLPAKSGAGDATSAGDVNSILDLRGIGAWLALALGEPQTHKAVTKQPTQVTGVTVHYAKTATTSGNGTLTFTATGKTLAWQASGDSTAGAAVDVSAGGRFTLESGTAGHDLVVEVDVPTLPTADKADADIAVSSVLKAHVFPFDLATRPSAMLELGHTDTNEYFRTLGAKVNSLTYDILAKDQNVKFNVIAGEETEYGTPWDATPTEYESVRACGSGGMISNGVNADLGVITGGDLTFSNNMSGISTADDREGYGFIDQGEITLQGKIKALFDSQGAYGLARTGTSTRVRIGSKAPVGSHVFSLVWDIPHAEFVEKAVPKSGKSGLFADMEWRAHRHPGGALPLVILVNDVPAY